METTINFGKIDFYGRGRKVNLVTVNLELTETKKGLEFTASATVWNSTKTDCVMAGQCLDTLYNDFKLKNNKLFKKIHELWKKYHLNGMHAGTKKQEDALKSTKWGGVNANYYKEQCEFLDALNLLVDNGYKYGTGWLLEEIPSDDLEVIKSIIEGEYQC